MSLSVFDAAREAPHAEALLCEGQRLSFEALAERVAARRQELVELGIDSRDRRPIALIADGSLAMFEYLYLLFALGHAVLPIHPRLTFAERERLLQLSAASTLLDPKRAPPFEQNSPHRWHPLPPLAETLPLAFIASSGSTGTPKLVELSRRAFLALARADAERVPAVAHDRALLCLPLSHVGGLSVVTRALIARRCCVAFRGGSGGLLGSIGELSALLAEERISLLSVVPAVLLRLLRDASGALDRAPLRALLVGGQACSPELFEEARARRLPVLTSYGMTEMCSQISTLHFPPPLDVPIRSGVVGVGFPLRGVDLRVVDGMIEVRGETLFSGYLGRPTTLSADGYFATGDRGEFDPRRGLFVYGRASELIITGGENVDPSEVEHALLACGGIEAACVFGVPDPEFGELVAAAIEPSPGTDWDEPALFRRLSERLASYKMPRLICRFAQLLRLASGKLDRAAIRSQALPRLEPVLRSQRGSEAN